MNDQTSKLFEKRKYLSVSIVNTKFLNKMDKIINSTNKIV